MSKIYYYDTTKKYNLPKMISNHVIDDLIGDSLSDMIENIEDRSLGLIVIGNTTNLNDADFVVKNEADKERLEKLLENVNKYTITVYPTNSGWFTNKCDSVVIISNKLDLSISELEGFIKGFFEIQGDGSSNRETVLRDVVIVNNKIGRYYVCNIRDSSNMMSCPNLDYAKSLCDTNPSCVVKDGDGKIIYKSRYGKVNISQTSTVVNSNGTYNSTLSYGERAVFNL